MNILRCPGCGNLPKSCACDLSKPRAIRLKGFTLWLDPSPSPRVLLELNLASTARVTATDFRDIGPTVLAWRDRLEIEAAGDLAKADPLLRLVAWVEDGFGDRAIASRFNRRWQEMLRSESPLTSAGGMNFNVMTAEFEMGKLGLSREKIEEAVRTPESFGAGFPLGPEWVRRRRAKILKAIKSP